MPTNGRSSSDCPTSNDGSFVRLAAPRRPISGRILIGRKRPTRPEKMIADARCRVARQWVSLIVAAEIGVGPIGNRRIFGGVIPAQLLGLRLSRDWGYCSQGSQCCNPQKLDRSLSQGKPKQNATQAPVVGQFDCGRLPGWKTGSARRILLLWQKRS